MGAKVRPAGRLNGPSPLPASPEDSGAEQGRPKGQRRAFASIYCKNYCKKIFVKSKDFIIENFDARTLCGRNKLRRTLPDLSKNAAQHIKFQPKTERP